MSDLRTTRGGRHNVYDDTVKLSDMELSSTGVPLVTPFDDAGDVDYAALADIAEWVVDRGVEFVVPCGSTSEAPLLTAAEQVAVVETVADAVSIPVLAGTGTEGLERTRRLTNRVADVGADAALVVTPHYYPHDADTLTAYYRDVADAAPIPVYLYSVPAFTGVSLAPETVGALADHPNVTGIKDSAGDIDAFQRAQARTPDAFTHLVGAGGVYANALDVGAAGGILALGNVVPEVASAVRTAHESGDRERAHRLNDVARDLNHALTAEYGIPGVKAAMRSRGVPAGRPRRPHRPVDEPTADRLGKLVTETLAAARLD
jgi:4-hydroxy-tetrahydrodipicolinate synthase